ncbi:vacuolar amino acid transporter 3 [[Candida] railenensis]|uniref:Vacuolar amino acid transporter 3 n=1 Tax=[Candida] railenensis TaxID=45579 RepID=A0A9P0QPN2_9ASCO|nr:vacuolar amino acid transporter 3 [[Candida] railenensis]
MSAPKRSPISFQSSSPSSMDTHSKQLRSSGSVSSSFSGSSPQVHNDNVSSYQEQISSISSNKDIDYRNLSKHMVSPEETLKMQGGDVARYLYHQIENSGSSPNSGSAGVSSPSGAGGKRRTRSSSFSTYLSEQRRESTASDINVPGGFRREFIINKALQENTTPPNFLTANFVEFLAIYGHFAGEDFSDDDEESQSEDGVDDEALYDEESSLLTNEARRGIYVHPPPPPPSKKSKRSAKAAGTTTVAKTYFLVFKALVGSGVLFLPRAFYNGGLGFSIFALALFGLLTFLCYLVLIESKTIFKIASFGELGFKTYGKPLKYSILFSIILSQIGFVATYILFTAENMISFCNNFLKWDGPLVTTGNIVLIQCILLIPLFLIRNLTKLSMISLISSAFIVVGLVIIFYYSGVQLLNNGLGPNIVAFNPNSWSMLIGVAVTSFEGIGLILPIEASMKNPEKFPQVLSISMTLITSLFVCVGVVGYTSFGDQVKSIIILNLPQDHVSVQMIQVLYSIAVFLSAPLQIFPVTKIVESTIFNSSLFFSQNGSKKKDEDGKLYRISGKYNKGIKWLKNLVRALIISAVSTIAYLNSKNIDKFISFNGCFACIPLVYIYPPLIHLKTYTGDYKDESFRRKLLKTFDYALIFTGIICVFYTTYQILFLN